MSGVERSGIGILGGTFDPPHLGHLLLAQAAWENLHLERVLFVPSFVQPHKQDQVITDALLRLQMVRLCVEDDPRFEVSDVEIKRGGVSFTVDTLRYFCEQSTGKSLWLIMGADNVTDIATWKEPETIFQLCRVAAAQRPDFVASGPYLERVIFFDMPVVAISASEIRRRVREGRPIRYMVRERVETFIHEHGLYR